MLPSIARTTLGTTLALALALGLATAASAAEPVLHPDKLLVLSTADVKGMTAPCGCHTPKGGLARRTSLVDSLRAAYGQVLLVDDGGFVPETDPRNPAVGFLLEAMRTLGTDAVTVSDKDFRLGRAWLVQRLDKSRLTVVSANLVDKVTKHPLFLPYVIKHVGTVDVGVFGLMTATGDLGPSRDSLAVEDPQVVARATIAEMKKQGATVIVLLSQLGKVDGEDLMASVDGIDAVVMGRNAPLLEHGRSIKTAIACYGGDQGHYVCRTELTLDARRHVTDRSADAVMLGPEVPDHPGVAALVKSFEDLLNHQAETTKAGEAPKDAAAK
jgi:5'-nucleotidase